MTYIFSSTKHKNLYIIACSLFRLEFFVFRGKEMAFDINKAAHVFYLSCLLEKTEGATVSNCYTGAYGSSSAGSSSTGLSITTCTEFCLVFYLNRFLKLFF